MVTTEKIVVTTTISFASSSSEPISFAIMALDTATGEPKTPIRVAYSAAPKSNIVKHTRNTKKGISASLTNETIDTVKILSFTFLKLNNPPRVIKATGVDVLEIIDKALYKKAISVSLNDTFVFSNNNLISKATMPNIIPMIKGFLIILTMVDLTKCLSPSSWTKIDKAIVAKILKIGIVISATKEATALALSPPIDVAKGIPIIA